MRRTRRAFLTVDAVDNLSLSRREPASLLELPHDRLDEVLLPFSEVSALILDGVDLVLDDVVVHFDSLSTLTQYGLSKEAILEPCQFADNYTQTEKREANPETSPPLFVRSRILRSPPSSLTVVIMDAPLKHLSSVVPRPDLDWFYPQTKAITSHRLLSLQ